MDNNFRIFFALVILVLLAPFTVSAQERIVIKEADLLKKLKLMPEAESLPAPDFVGVTPEGKKISLDSLKGKLVLLNYDLNNVNSFPSLLVPETFAHYFAKTCVNLPLISVLTFRTHLE